MDRRSFLYLLLAALFRIPKAKEPPRSPWTPLEDVFIPTKFIGVDMGVGPDHSVIAAVARTPDRKLFIIDVGELPKGDADAYVKQFMERFRERFKRPDDGAEPSPV